jgi:hypothetical protein
LEEHARSLNIRFPGAKVSLKAIERSLRRKELGKKSLN